MTDRKLKRRVIRRRNTPTQKQIDTRMREMWSTGFGMFPQLLEMQAERVRLAMRNLAEDDAYWEGVKELARAKQHAEDLAKALIRPPA